MSENSVNFVCPKCSHRYSSAANAGPRAVCPECEYSPTLIEFGDDRHNNSLPYVIGILVMAMTIGGLFWIVMR
jgi:hypothetical protein